MGLALSASACPFLVQPARAQSAAISSGIEVELSAQLRHETNVARTDAVRAELRGLTQADQRLALGTGLIVDRAIGTFDVQLNAFAGYDFYNRNSELNRERLRLSGAFSYNAGPCVGRFLPEFRRAQSELAELSIVNAPGIESVRNAQTEQTYRAELACGRSTGLRPAVFYERARGSNSNPLRGNSDFRAERFGVGVEYENPVLGEYTLSANRQDVGYPSRRTGVLSANRGYRLDQLTLEGSRDIGAVIVAEFGVGYAHLKPDSATMRDFKGLSWKLAATVTPLLPLQFRLNTEQTLSPTLSSESLYTRTRSFGVEAAFALTPRTSIMASLGRADRTYRGATSLIGPLLSEDQLDKAAIRLDFAPGRRLKFGLEAGHERRTANGQAYDFRNNFIALQTRFTLGS